MRYHIRGKTARAHTIIASDIDTKAIAPNTATDDIGVSHVPL